MVAAETALGGPSGREFPKTRWTLIVSSRQSPEARSAAFEELAAAYWRPLYVFARRKGRDVEAAKDAVQGFFAHLLERRDFLARLDPGKGRFRSYVRAALGNYLANAHEVEAARKRGGGATILSIDGDLAERDLASAPADADAACDREWALGVMERALGGLRREFEDGSRRGPIDLALRFFKPDAAAAPTYADAAESAAMTVPQFKAFLHRARARFRELVRSEVADTVSDPRDVDAEIQYLLRALSGAER